MVWNLSSRGKAAYRASQFAAVLIIGIRTLSPGIPDGAASVALFFEIAAVLLLCSVVRMLGGNVAAAVSLLLISISPKSADASPANALSFLCLATLIWLLTTRDWTRDTSSFPFSLALAALIALGSYVNLSFLAVSPAVAFACLLLRCVPSDSVRPYRTLFRSLRTHRSSALLNTLVIVGVPLLSLAVSHISGSGSTASHSAVNCMPTEPLQYASAACRLLFQYLKVSGQPGTVLAAFAMLLPVAFSITLWWLFVSVQSGSGLPFSLSAIPVAYLLGGSLRMISRESYGAPTHPILLANLITLIGIWLRGRANKRVVDSTTN